MRSKNSKVLHELAARLGIQTAYVDMAGHRQEASDSTLMPMMRALGANVNDAGEAGDALEDMRQAKLNRWLEPVCVQWHRGPSFVTLRLPESLPSGALRVAWQMEDGELVSQSLRWGKSTKPRRLSNGGGGRVVAFPLHCPKPLAPGYHKLVCSFGERQVSSTLIVAPRRCYRPVGKRRDWGVFAPLYGLHSARSWGVGDYGDLERLLAWTGEGGGSFVGTLPLLPAFLDDPCEPSPYSPVTRLGWNEVFLDVESVPELAECPGARRLMESPTFRRRLGGLRRKEVVDYRVAMELKREVLTHLSRRFFRQKSSRRAEFEGFIRDHPHISDYARFRAVGEKLGRCWQQWPRRLRSGELRPGDGSGAVEGYHAYVQWLAHGQMEQTACRAREHSVSLYLDMPLGTHREGYDAWRYRDLFAPAASGGAPPDPVFTQGQNWGFAPIHPERSREQGHAYLVAYLRHHLRQAGMLRFDHVMGLHRLYWVPEGLPASQGAYVKYPAKEFYAVLCLESHRHRAVIVGENLGTVSPEVDTAMARRAMAGMYVAQYEFRPPPRRPLRPVPRNVVASVNTHDMPPFHAWFQGLDLEDRRQLGLLTHANVRRERELRKLIMGALRKSLPTPGGFADNSPLAGILLRGLLEAFAGSEARYLLLNIEDLWLETLPQNVPGTSSERVNWRHRLRLSMGELEEDPRVAAWLAAVHRRRRRRRLD